ncbi:MAG: tRNA-intron lyase, partial [Bacteroidetes bacterium]|nr:tRNA-intron lyase [Bacteroidota bacterium]
MRFCVFRDIRNRGYIIKTALKFGADFRVYDRGVKPGEDHAKWVVYPVHETEVLTWHDFSAKNRVAHSTKKKLLIGIVDDEEDVRLFLQDFLIDRDLTVEIAESGEEALEKMMRERRAVRMVRSFMSNSKRYRENHLKIAERSREMYENWNFSGRTMINRANLRLPFAYTVVETQLL